MTMALKLIGKPAVEHNLCGSLQADISKTKELLEWKPPSNTDESMKKAVNFFLESNNKK